VAFTEGLAPNWQARQPVGVFGLLAAKHSPKFPYIVPAFGGDLVTHPPDFFKNLVFHARRSTRPGSATLLADLESSFPDRPLASFRQESENSGTASETKAQLGRPQHGTSSHPQAASSRSDMVYGSCTDRVRMVHKATYKPPTSHPGASLKHAPSLRIRKV
jgi:hypothetical protein